MPLTLYVAAPSPLHRLHPVTKLVGLLAFVVAAFVVDDPRFELPLAAAVGGLRPRQRAALPRDVPRRLRLHPRHLDVLLRRGAAAHVGGLPLRALDGHPARHVPRRRAPLPERHPHRGGGLRPRAARGALRRRVYAHACFPARAGLLRRGDDRGRGAALSRARVRPWWRGRPAAPLRAGARARVHRGAAARRSHGDGARAARLQLGAAAHGVPARAGARGRRLRERARARRGSGLSRALDARPRSASALTPRKGVPSMTPLCTRRTAPAVGSWSPASGSSRRSAPAPRRTGRRSPPVAPASARSRASTPATCPRGSRARFAASTPSAGWSGAISRRWTSSSTTRSPPRTWRWRVRAFRRRCRRRSAWGSSSASAWGASSRSKKPTGSSPRGTTGACRPSSFPA